MQTIRINTTQNIEIEYEIGGLGERILALLIDYGIFFFIYIFSLIIGAIFSVLRESGVVLIVVIIIYAALFVFYDLLCEVFMNGQSIGKRVMKIKVMSVDGRRPKFSQYLLRWIFRIVDFTLTFGACGLITAMVTEKCQRLGDLAAGTILIKTSPRSKMNSLVFTPVFEGYVPVFNQVTCLKDKDIIFIHEVLSSYHKSGNSVIVYNTAQQLKKVLGVTVPAGMDDLLFLETLVKDYNHLTATAETL